jgi:hypothetical protein
VEGAGAGELQPEMNSQRARIKTRMVLENRCTGERIEITLILQLLSAGSILLELNGL